MFRLRLDARLHRQLSALAREELVHFERTLRLLERRQVAFLPLVSSGYAEKLKKAIRRDMPDRIVDELLVAAVIERRSHERMTMLAEALVDREPEVAAFYADLCPSEDRHEELYLELAGMHAAGGVVADRYRELLAHEADVLQQLPFTARLHGGAPDGLGA